MKISIITPVYNRVDTIERAILSVQNQSHLDIEHIVVDGGSTDGTLELIKEFLSSYSVLISEPDLGIYDAINKGIGLSTGDVIGVMHSDDYYSTVDIISRVEKLFAEISIDAVFGDVAYFNARNPGVHLRRYSSAKFDPSKLRWGWMPAHTSLFLRRSVYNEYGIYNIKYKIAADFELVCRIFRGNKVNYIYIPEVLVNMQTGGASTNGIQSTFTLNWEVLRACRENGLKSNIFMILSKYPAKLLELTRL